MYCEANASVLSVSILLPNHGAIEEVCKGLYQVAHSLASLDAVQAKREELTHLPFRCKTMDAIVNCAASVEESHSLSLRVEAATFDGAQIIAKL